MPQPPRLDDKQQAGLQAIADAQWLKDLYDHFRPLYPPDAAGTYGYRSDDELRQRIVRDVERARGYRFAVNKDVFAYLQVSLELGENFPREPRYTWARAILEEEPRKKLHDGTFSSSVDNRGDRLLAAMKAQRIINDAGADQWK